MRNHDKMKDDAIAQLSDQLLAISTRLQEVERKQQQPSTPLLHKKGDDFDAMYNYL
ncbi:MAG: hypothetical protein ACJ71O_00270 [Nitrososphaeraceae archaeon]